jgi:cellulose synthase/poly-beta-1,6-N-acetylglucosamine synthase-like glycosyltransferase
MMAVAAAGGGSGGDGEGGGGSSGGGDSSSGDVSGGGGGGRLLLLTTAVWAAHGLASEAWSVWQYRTTTAPRDAARRAELFPGPQPSSSDSGSKPRRRAPAGGMADPPPTVSIIIPVLNEELCIEATLRHVQRQLAPAAAEVVVVDGGSSDATVALARRCGARVVQAGRGRARQMNAGAAAASGDILVFLHADTRPPEGLVAEVRRALGQAGVVLGGFRPRIGECAGCSLVEVVR